MCQAVYEALQECKAQGYAEGKIQGIVQGKEEERRTTITKLMKKFNINQEEAMDV